MAIHRAFLFQVEKEKWVSPVTKAITTFSISKFSTSHHQPSTPSSQVKHPVFEAILLLITRLNVIMSDWNTEEVNGTSADGEQTNGFEANGAEANGTQANGASIGPKEEDLAKAREAGWTERTVHNYNDGDASAVDWAGAAAKYEWSDEYGEVGPEVPELERTLFGGEFQMRRGDHISNLELLVGTEGRTQIAPVREVRTLATSFFT